MALSSRTVRTKRSSTSPVQGKAPNLQILASELSDLVDQVSEVDQGFASIEIDFKNPLSALTSVLKLNKHLCKKLLDLNAVSTEAAKSAESSRETADLMTQLRLKDQELKLVRADLATSQSNLDKANRRLKHLNGNAESKHRRGSSGSSVKSSTARLTKEVSPPPSLEISKYRELVDSGKLLENFDGEVSTFIDSQAQAIENYQKRLRDAERRALSTEPSVHTTLSSRPQSALECYTDRSDTILVADLKEQIALYQEQINLLSSQLRLPRARNHVNPKMKAQLEVINDLFATQETALASDKWRDVAYLEFDGDSYERTNECLREVVLLRDAQLTEFEFQLSDIRIMLEKANADLKTRNLELAQFNQLPTGKLKRNVNAEYEAEALHSKVDFLTQTLDARETHIKSLIADCSSVHQLKAKLETKLRVMENELKASQCASEPDRVTELLIMVRRKDEEIEHLLERIEMLERVDNISYDAEGLYRECERLRAFVNEKELLIEDLLRKADNIRPVQINSRYSKPSEGAEAALKTEILQKRLADVLSRLAEVEELAKSKDALIKDLQAKAVDSQKQHGDIRLRPAGLQTSASTALIGSPHFRSNSMDFFLQDSWRNLPDYDKTTHELTSLKVSLDEWKARCAMLEAQLDEANRKVSLFNSSYSPVDRLGEKDLSPASLDTAEHSTRDRNSLPRQFHSLADKAKDREADFHTQTNKYESRPSTEKLARRQKQGDLSSGTANLDPIAHSQDIQSELKRYKEATSASSKGKPMNISELLYPVESSSQLQPRDEKTQILTLKAELAEIRGKLEAKERGMSPYYVRKDWVEELLKVLEPSEVDLITDIDQSDYYSRIQRAIARVKYSGDNSYSKTLKR